MARLRQIPAALLVIFAVAPLALAQPPVGADDLPELPSFEPVAREPGRVLPSISLPAEDSTDAMSSGRRVFIVSFRITGNQALSDEDLAPITAPFSNREVSFEELQVLKDKLTLAYIQAGYISSGAVIPDQVIENGVFEIQIVEGVLGEIEVSTDGTLPPSYVTERLRQRAGGVINIFEVEEQLQILQRGDRIRRIAAELVPTEESGVARLMLEVQEEKPFSASLELNNHLTPTIGAEGAWLRLTHADVSGRGDRFDSLFRVSEGLRSIFGSYEIPLNARDTTLGVNVTASWSDVTDNNFSSLDIESRAVTYGLALSHPVYRTPRTNLVAFVTGEHRRSKSFILGTSLPSQGIENGLAKVTVIRAGLAYAYRGRRQIVAARTTLSRGIDALRSTTQSGNLPDSRFLAWHSQIHLARRFQWLDALVVLRGEAQLTDDPLLGLEQIGVGGHVSVRGYREDALVRDNGAIASIEMRVPILYQEDGTTRLEIGPFTDIGYAWNESRESQDRRLWSAGIVLRAVLTERVTFEGSWAADLKRIETSGEHNLQDSGIQFRLIATY